MKKTLRIELDYNWVLTRIDDAKYPVEVLKDRFVKGKIEKINESYLHLTLAVDENDYEKTKNKISTFFAQKYGKANLSALSFSDCEPNTNVENDESKNKDSDKSDNTQDPHTIDDTRACQHACRRTRIQKPYKRTCGDCTRSGQKQCARRVYVPKLSLLCR